MRSRAASHDAIVASRSGGTSLGCIRSTVSRGPVCEPGLTAAQYRETHGLLRSRGLVAQDLRLVMATTAGAHYGENAGLARSRDPARASAARLARKMPASAQEAEGRDRRMAEVGRSARRASVVLCQGCGVAFCPLVDVARRRFCTRSCASRHTRSQDSQPSPHAAAPS